MGIFCDGYRMDDPAHMDCQSTGFECEKVQWEIYRFYCLGCPSIMVWNARKRGQTVWDQFLFMFIGGSRQAFYFKSFLCYWVLYFGVIYLVQLHLQTELSEMGYYKLVRYQSISRWFWAWYHKTMLYIGLYLFALALLALFILSLKRFFF